MSIIPNRAGDNHSQSNVFTGVTFGGMMSAVQHTFPPGPRNRFPAQNLLRISRLGIVPFFQQIQAEHGDVASFRLGRRRIFLISHPDHIKDILVTRADKFTKGPALRMAKITLGEGLLTSEGDFHKRQRRIMQPAFHAQRVADYTPTIVRFGAQMRDSWQAGDVIDMKEAMTLLTLRIVAKALFDAEIEEEVAEIGHAMDISVKMFDRTRYPWARLLNILPLPSNIRFEKARRRVFATIDRMIADRRANPGDRNDFLSILLKARDEEGDRRGMTDEQLRFEAMTLFSAGHETTANALVWTWLLLAENPQAGVKMREEISRVLGDRLPTGADAANLPYTRAVLAESMRLYPPAWIIGREAVEPYAIGDWTIPSGGVILMSQFIVHRDQRWWDEPERFRPQRWLSESKRPKYAYFPFGGGTRQCIGEAFAWLEGILLLATIAQRWRFERADEKKVELHATITLRPSDELKMRILRADG